MREDESEGADILLVGLILFVFMCMIMVASETHLMHLLNTQNFSKFGFAGEARSSLFGYHKAA